MPSTIFAGWLADRLIKSKGIFITLFFYNNNKNESGIIRIVWCDQRDLWLLCASWPLACHCAVADFSSCWSRKRLHFPWRCFWWRARSLAAASTTLASWSILKIWRPSTPAPCSAWWTRLAHCRVLSASNSPATYWKRPRAGRSSSTRRHFSAFSAFSSMCCSEQERKLYRMWRRNKWKNDLSFLIHEGENNDVNAISFSKTNNTNNIKLVLTWNLLDL